MSPHATEVERRFDDRAFYEVVLTAQEFHGGHYSPIFVARTDLYEAPKSLHPDGAFTPTVAYMGDN